MVYQDIVKYLEEGKRRGFSIQLLKRKLLEGGFSEKEIDDAIAAMDVPAFADKPQFKQPSEEKMPVTQMQQFRQGSGNQEGLGSSDSKPRTFAQPLQGIQQKQEMPLAEKKIERVKGGEGKWMMIGGVLGIILVVLMLGGIVLNFLAAYFLMNLLEGNSLTTLIISIVLVLVYSLYSFAFVRLGKNTNQRMLVMGSWFSIIPVILYLILGVVAGLFVYEQAINFFNGSGSEGSYQIMFMILAILWVVALLLHVIGIILTAIGMLKIGKDVKLMNVSGLINIVVFVCGLGFLAGIIIFVYSVLNAFSIATSGTLAILDDANIAIYSLIGFMAIKSIGIIFEVIGLFNASKKFE